MLSESFVFSYNDFGLPNPCCRSKTLNSCTYMSLLFTYQLQFYILNFEDFTVCIPALLYFPY